MSATDARGATFLRHWSQPTDSAGWLRDLRSRAVASVEAHGFPTTKNEDWHFTNPAPITEAEFEPMQSAVGGLTTTDLAAIALVPADWTTLVFVNGRHAPHLSQVTGLPDGVRLMSLASAWHEEPTLVEQHLGQHAKFEDQALAFTALNTALAQDGAYLSVAAGVEVAQPIHLLFVTDANAAGGVTHPRNLLVVGRHARITVVEQYVTTHNTRYLTNVVTEAAIGDGATLTHYKLQREGPQAYHVGHIESSLGRDAHYVSFAFSTGASLARSNIYTTLGGEGCGATLNGLYMLGDAQVSDHQTRIEHAQPNCYSREHYKGVLDDASHGVFNGKVYVHAIAQKTDGKQTNNTLLLSPDARIDTKPQLEIFADDVKCTHGATVGQLDDRMAFYLKSRGIGAAAARQLLTYAFAADVLETIELEPLRVALERLALERFVG
jgi:Fe-S cluster assembly protein SufD